METFTISIIKILRYLNGLVITAFIIVGVIYYITPDFALFLSPIAQITFGLFFIFYSIGNVILLINHYKHFKNSLLQYNAATEEITFTQGFTTVRFQKADICEIKQLYARTGSIPWQDVCIWEIYLNDQKVTLAPILINQKDFKRLFSELNIQLQHKFFVSL